jgi:hypothetical protein
MPRIRITEKGFAGYTGPIAEHSFTDGVSDDVLSGADALRIGSAMRVENVETGAATGIAQHLLDTKNASAEVKTTRDAFQEGRSDKYHKESGESVKTDVDKHSKVVEPTESDSLMKDLGVSEEVKKPSNSKYKYTMDDLEAIADEKGIIGLREFASKFGVQGSAVVQIIKDLMQLKHTAEIG